LVLSLVVLLPIHPRELAEGPLGTKQAVETRTGLALSLNAAQVRGIARVGSHERALPVLPQKALVALHSTGILLQGLQRRGPLGCGPASRRTPAHATAQRAVAKRAVRRGSASDV
jgi:hypothetical protein